MEWCNGGDLSKFILKRKNQGKPFIENEIAKHLANIALGLNELHNNRIMHRDLKP